MVRIRKRDTYSWTVTQMLISCYRQKSYLRRHEYLEVGQMTGLTLRQVRTWYANARRRLRR